MIILDIETSGLTGREGIWQIGALEFENPKNHFLEESRIDDEDNIMPGALKVNGKTEEELRDAGKQSQKEMIEKFLGWLEKLGNRVIVGANIGFDIQMIQEKCIKYGLTGQYEKLIGHRGIDMLDLAQEIYFGLNGEYKLSGHGTHGMSLGKASEFAGIPDDRMGVSIGGDLTREGKAHDALEDCRIEAEVFSRLKFGKNLFPEFSKFEIPDYLKNDNI